MKANEYDTNLLDSEVLLPPRKRLLAGLKRQSSGSASQSSPESHSPPPTPMNEYDLRFQNLLKSYKNGSWMSPEEIAKAAGKAAVAAAKAAEAARAAAEEKAVIAAKAVTAAKDALSLIASFSKETDSREGQSKRNKLKKHVPVQLLYKEQRAAEKCGMDEELAQKLHRAINSSPRITRHSLGSKNKHKKHKPVLHHENNGFPNGVAAEDGKLASPCGADMPDDPDSEGSYEESYVAKVKSGEGESSHSKERVIEPSDAMDSNGRKRGRIKQKKLSLSLCSFKDRANPKDELSQKNSLDQTRDAPPSSMEPRANTLLSNEPVPTWKCQDFKVPQCIKPNKVVQS